MTVHKKKTHIPFRYMGFEHEDRTILTDHSQQQRHL